VPLPKETFVTRVLAIVLLPLAAIALVAGCGDGSDHNSQDVSFAQDMVPHHQQAVTMADLATSQTQNPQIVDLAGRIKASQTSQITLMTGWLTSWGKKPTEHSGDMSGMAGMAGMKGMVSDTDMKALAAASGAEFDRLFVQRMTAHHQGALEMAKAESDAGRFKPAKALADAITADQQREIAEMAGIKPTAGAPAP
jgi:uncharacterized protein (DUF305 family)